MRAGFGARERLERFSGGKRGDGGCEHRPCGNPDTFHASGFSGGCRHSHPARAGLRGCRNHRDVEQKQAGRHPRFGTIYFWCLVGVVITASSLAAVRWTDDAHLFLLGALSFASAYLGRRARRQRWRDWARLHVTGMGSSYIFLLTAFYVDNGKNLPLCKELPQIAFWVLPAAVGVPLIVYTLARHPLARQSTSPNVR